MYYFSSHPLPKKKENIKRKLSHHSRSKKDILPTLGEGCHHLRPKTTNGEFVGQILITGRAKRAGKPKSKG